MKYFLLTIIILLTTTSIAQPIIDGTFDGENVWGTPYASGNGSAGWDNANAKSLYLVEDQNYIYLGVELVSSDWKSWAFIFNTTNGGSSSGAWTRNIAYGHSELPDYEIRGSFDGWSQSYSWNDTSSSWGDAIQLLGNGTDTGDVGENITPTNTDGWLEIRVSKSDLGNPSNLDFQFYISGNNDNHGSFDSIPEDDFANDWNNSNNVLDQYASSYTLSIEAQTDFAKLFVSTTGDIYFGEKGHYELEVFNVQGKRVLNKSLDTQSTNQKVNFGLTKGLYLIKVKTEISTNSFVKKMLVK